MTKLLAQHGPAKGQKIEDGISASNLSGVIFSQNDETFLSISSYCTRLGSLSKDNTFFDPQFYYSTFESEILKKLGDLDTFPSLVTRKDWRKRSSVILNFLDDHALKSKEISNTLITPGFFINDIDWKFDYSVELYNHCVSKYSEFNDYALTLMLSTSFFANKSNIEELLDVLNESIVEKKKIYFVICHEQKNGENNYESIDQSWLANILFTVHSLQELGFKIIMGYGFMNSVLFAMLDVEYISSGWFNTLRKFEKTKFELTESFGRRKKRYTSLPLLSYIMIDDLNNMLDTSKVTISDLMSNTTIDSSLLSDSSTVSFVDLEHQYWESLKIIFDELAAEPDLKNRVLNVKRKIDNAINLYTEVIIELEQSSQNVAAKRLKDQSKHLYLWKNAIEIFKSKISLI
ncbi:hypothetical protein SFC11_05775 [Exiguobacterium indicum]|uniref:hypothetical protein n=1 Tax=Exiguobacterium indicum TaxID=296995 RepID=UPI00398203D4